MPLNVRPQPWLLACTLTALGSLACVLPAARALAAQGAAPFTLEDLDALKRVTDPQVSPDGRFVVFVQRETDLDANKGRTSLWLLPLVTPGAQPQRLIDAASSASSPRWASDSRTLYFLSTASGSSQVWRLMLGDRAAQRVTDYPLDVGSLKVSPRGDRLALTMEVFPDCPTLACTRARLDARGKDKANARTYERIFVRHWDSWSNGTRSHLFTARLTPGGTTEPPVDVSRGFDADIPGKPFGGDEDFAFSPDGSTLVFSARIAGRDEPWSTNFDLFLTAVDGSAAPVNLTADNPAWDAQPVFLADGDLAWLAQERPGFESDRFHIMLKSGRSGKVRSLTGGWDRSVAHLGATPDGKALLAGVDELGQRLLYRVDPSSGVPTRLTSSGTVEAFSAARERVVLARADLGAPADLYSLPSRGGTPQRLTDVNHDLLATRHMSEYEQFSFRGWNDETVYGYVVKPYGFESGKRYPIAFVVHGGPQVSMQNLWTYRWNAQAFAGGGYAVVMIDFHGSPGYGQAFTDSISRRLGRQTARRPAEGPGGRAGEVPLARRRARLRAGRLVRRLHDELDRGQLAGALPLHRQSRRHIRPAHDVLLDRGAVVPGVGVRRPVLPEPAGLRAVQPGRLRLEVAHADAGDPRRAGFPHSLLPGDRRLHRAAAPRHREQAADLPGRESLGAQARQQHPVVPHGARVAR